MNFPKKSFFQKRFWILQIFIFVVLDLVLLWQYQAQHTSFTNAAFIPSSTNLVLNGIETKDQTIVHYNSCSLSVEKLGLQNIPVALKVDAQNQDQYLKALEKGVAHMDGSSLPGNTGNSVIFGHSSYNFWAKGNYKSIFAKLNLLEPKDTIRMSCDERKMNFTVKEKHIVNPKDISVLNLSGGKYLTLLTCWPPGSVVKRLVVISEKTRLEWY